MDITVNETVVEVTSTDTSIVVDVTPNVFTVETSTTGPQGAKGNDGLVPVFSRQNEISPVTGKGRFYFEGNRTITKIRASVGTPATGSSIVVDVLVNGSSIGTTTIPAGEYTATTTLSQAVTTGSYATVSILSVGSTYSGSDLTVVLTVN
jgi:hypothetical protein